MENYKTKTILIAEYSQTGHYMYNEDTWEDSCEIKDEKDLLKACKNWLKQSASTFNNYPFGGLFSFNNIAFKMQSIIIDSSGEIFYGKIKDCDPPEYLKSTKTQFDEWYKALKKRLPRLRKAQKERLKKEADLQLLEKLSLKYNQ